MESLGKSGFRMHSHASVQEGDFIANDEEAAEAADAAAAARQHMFRQSQQHSMFPEKGEDLAALEEFVNKR